jgi:hypothetical protein
MTADKSNFLKLPAELRLNIGADLPARESSKHHTQTFSMEQSINTVYGGHKI